MRTRSPFHALLCSVKVISTIIVLFCWQSSIEGSPFTYTTVLSTNNLRLPLTLTFKLYEAPEATNALVTATVTNVVLGIGGRFNQELNFESELKVGVRRWLEIQSGETVLRHRQQVLVASNGVLAELQTDPKWYEFASMAIGAFSVMFFSLARFNTPPTNRASTSAFRYWLAALLYSAAALLFYFILVFFPQAIRLVEPDAQGLPELINKLATPLGVALVLTTLLPNVPGLAKADKAIRDWFQTRAEIPLAAELLRRQLASSEFTMPENRRAAVVKRLIEKNQFDAADIESADAGESAEIFKKISYLTATLEDEAGKRFRAYHRLFPTELADLTKGYEDLKNLARKWLKDFQKKAAPTDERLEHIRSHFNKDAETLLDKTYTYISRALFQCQVVHRARNDLIKELGFSVELTKAQLTMHHLTALFLLVSAAMLMTFAFLRTTGQQESYERMIAKATMIGLIYCVAVAAAVYPRRWWKWAQLQAGGTRPYAFYLLAGGIGIIAAFIVNLVFNYLVEAGVGSKVFANIKLKYPYLITAAITAGATAWSNDNKPGAKEGKWRLVEGGVQSILAGIVGYGIHAMLEANYLNAGLRKADVPPVGWLIGTFMFVGFIVGYCVPHWCRKLEAEIAPKPLAPERSSTPRATLPSRTERQPNSQN
jgi:hypothetical protein